MQIKEHVMLQWQYYLELEFEGDEIDDEGYIRAVLGLFPMSALRDWYLVSGYQGNISIKLQEAEVDEEDDNRTGWGDNLELEEE